MFIIKNNKMKKFTFLIAIATLFLSACTHVYFVNPQPKGAKQLSEIPKELCGKWDNEFGGVHIEFDKITMYDISRDSLDNIIYTNYTITPLSDMFRLYKAEDFYVFNLTEYEGYWEVGVVSIEKNGDIITYYISDVDALSNDPNLKVTEANYLVGDEEIMLTELNPEYDETEFLMHVVFSGQMSVKSLRKMMVPENILYIFKPDGRFLYPGELEGE